MADDEDILSLDDAALLAECDVHIYRSSGPGGQHRNKVSSAVRLRHRPSGVTAQAVESRSQHENKRMAIRRLRMNIACRIRWPVRFRDSRGPGERGDLVVPPVVAGCIFTPRGKGADSRGAGARKRIDVGRRDERFWQVSAFLLDLLDACDGRLSQAAACLSVTTGSLVALLKSDRHLLAAAQGVRRNHSRHPLS